jgi:hypothetical protein
MFFNNNITHFVLNYKLFLVFIFAINIFHQGTFFGGHAMSANLASALDRFRAA